ncbi:hypothetical protein GWI33_000026 [Rhynchophorus ferrugineus]|uniref:Uncharacterized protein n=1 Tax=Rhynchophorus ferrugineus TaxID=354439 RepID=A0A834J0J5_RHYFE|nr:hypothetical protein GWI33_000026 [Rhynchophorus ferrugineus]
MIDWVSIVRHSRRRFSNYMYGVPRKVRKKRQKNARSHHNSRTHQEGAAAHDLPSRSECTCCWAGEKVKQKSRYVEDDMPPPPSPPMPSKVINAAVVVDNLSRQSSLERVSSGRRKSASDRGILNDVLKETSVHKMRFRRHSAPVILERAAFHYDAAIDYCADKSVTIGEMTIVCKYCEALKYSGESTGLCCAGGKGKYKGEDVLTQCTLMIPTALPFDFKPLRFPVRLAFVMTINKSKASRWKFAEPTWSFPVSTKQKI